MSGGSIGHRCGLRLLFSEELQIANNSAITEAREKICTYFESLEFWKFLMYV
jgi:hypothetical protein